MTWIYAKITLASIHLGKIPERSSHVTQNIVWENIFPLWIWEHPRDLLLITSYLCFKYWGEKYASTWRTSSPFFFFFFFSPRPQLEGPKRAKHPAPPSGGTTSAPWWWITWRHPAPSSGDSASAPWWWTTRRHPAPSSGGSASAPRWRITWPLWWPRGGPPSRPPRPCRPPAKKTDITWCAWALGMWEHPRDLLLITS